MLGDQDRLALALPPRDVAAQGVDAPHIQVARRLVQHQHIGTAGLGGRAAHALRLSARKLKDPPPQKSFYVKIGRRPLHGPANHTRLASQILANKGQLTAYLGIEHLRLGVLEHARHAPGDLVHVHLAQRDAVQAHFSVHAAALVVRHQAVCHLERRRLSAARTAAQQDDLARAHAKVQVLHHGSLKPLARPARIGKPGINKLKSHS